VFSVILTSIESGGTAVESLVKMAFMYPSSTATRHARSHSLIADAFQAGSCAMMVVAARQRLAALIRFNVFIAILQARSCSPRRVQDPPLRSGTRTKRA
jgi:hypothetical protein